MLIRRGTPIAHDDKSEIEIIGGDREIWSNIYDVGYPIIADTIPNLLLERYCFSVSYNTFTRQPNWVMWQLTGEHVLPKKDGVWNEYREDTELPLEIRSA